MVRSDLNTGVSTILTINIDTVKLFRPVDHGQQHCKDPGCSSFKVLHTVAPWYLLYELLQSTRSAHSHQT